MEERGRRGEKPSFGFSTRTRLHVSASSGPDDPRMTKFGRKRSGVISVFGSAVTSVIQIQKKEEKQTLFNFLIDPIYDFLSHKLNEAKRSKRANPTTTNIQTMNGNASENQIEFEIGPEEG